MSIEVIPAPRYWLISNEDVRTLIASLEGEALHTLESGLHVTDALPADEIQAQADDGKHQLGGY